MKIHECEQGTLDWLKLHVGLPTSGGLHELIDTKFEPRTGEMPKTYLCKKLAELYRGKPLITLGSNGADSWSVDQGLMLEEEAIPFFEFHTNARTQRVGFVTTDDGKFGCSPDAFILGKNQQPAAGLEIKCPAAETHVKYLMAGVVPSQYLAQVHGGLFATGLKHWVFMSYRRSFPVLMVKVERDEAIMQKIQTAIDKFTTDLTAGKTKLDTLETFGMSANGNN